MVTEHRCPMLQPPPDHQGQHQGFGCFRNVSWVWSAGWGFGCFRNVSGRESWLGRSPGEKEHVLEPAASWAAGAGMWPGRGTVIPIQCGVGGKGTPGVNWKSRGPDALQLCLQVVPSPSSGVCRT